MKKILMAVVIAGLAMFYVERARAELDTDALKVIQMIKDGSEGSHKGHDGILRTPRISGQMRTSYRIGAGANGVQVSEYGDGLLHKTVIVGESIPIVTLEAGEATNGVGSVKIYDFPEGRIWVGGSLCENFTVVVDTNALDDADGGDFAFGTSAAGGASGLTSGEVNLIPSTSIDAITNVTDSVLSTSAQFDGTSTALDVYVNLEVDDADIAANCTNYVSFTHTITWLDLGDY